MSNNPYLDSFKNEVIPIAYFERLDVISTLNVSEKNANILRTNELGKVVQSNTMLNFVSLTDNKTVSLKDANTVYINDTTKNYTVTIPDKDEVNFPIGTTFKIFCQNKGKVSFSMQSDEYGIAGGGTLAVSTKYGSITIEKVSSTFWMVTGDVTP